uniref:Maturase K n=1 Tax=Romanomermis culicivorax TaxID=13658 RepID=A0A915HNR1_ROMCU
LRNFNFKVLFLIFAFKKFDSKFNIKRLVQTYIDFVLILSTLTNEYYHQLLITDAHIFSLWIAGTSEKMMQ